MKSLKVINGVLMVNCLELTGLEPFTVDGMKSQIASEMGIAESEFYLMCDGKKLQQDGFNICNSSRVTVELRVLGGKGGFGSMLRAIGAQIEKTTNRDACRDLSGRRLRDINEEQRLKRWFSKQKERETEKTEAKKRKLAKLKQFTEGPPLPQIDDPQYNKQRADMADSVYAAVDKGFEVHVPAKASSSASATVTSASDESSKDSSSSENPVSTASLEAPTPSSSAGPSSSSKPVKKKTLKKLMMDEEFDSCSSSEDESSEEATSPKKAKME